MLSGRGFISTPISLKQPIYIQTKGGKAILSVSYVSLPSTSPTSYDMDIGYYPYPKINRTREPRYLKRSNIL